MGTLQTSPMVNLFLLEQCLTQQPCLPVTLDILLLETLLESAYPVAIGLDMHIVRVRYYTTL